MRYHEIAEQQDRGQQERLDQSRNRRSLSARNLSPKLVEEPINRLFHDLMTALEDRMMNVNNPEWSGGGGNGRDAPALEIDTGEDGTFHYFRFAKHKQARHGVHFALFQQTARRTRKGSMRVGGWKKCGLLPRVHRPLRAYDPAGA
jgi:hypothetical protein